MSARGSIGPSSSIESHPKAPLDVSVGSRRRGRRRPVGGRYEGGTRAEVGGAAGRARRTGARPKRSRRRGIGTASAGRRDRTIGNRRRTAVRAPRPKCASSTEESEVFDRIDLKTIREQCRKLLSVVPMAYGIGTIVFDRLLDLLGDPSPPGKRKRPGKPCGHRKGCLRRQRRSHRRPEIHHEARGFEWCNGRLMHPASRFRGGLQYDWATVVRHFPLHFE